MKALFYGIFFRNCSNFAILQVEIVKLEVMEQNGPQIRNQRTHISLEHYDTSRHQFFFVDQCYQANYI